MNRGDALAVFHCNRRNGFGDMLKGVGAELQERVDVAPCDNLQGVAAGGVQLAHRMDIQVIGFLLDGVDSNDALLEGLGFLKLRELVHQGAHLLAAAHDGIDHLECVGANLKDIVKVQAMKDAFDVIGHRVELVA